MIVQLFPLPCGCVAEDITLHLRDDYRRRISADVGECVWCGATFTTEDFFDWAGEGAPELVIGQQPPALFRMGSFVVEVMGPCSDCGVPLVRFAGGTTAHLTEATKKSLQPMRN